MPPVDIASIRFARKKKGQLAPAKNAGKPVPRHVQISEQLEGDRYQARKPQGEPPLFTTVKVARK